jgi:hypothetical protein
MREKSGIKADFVQRYREQKNPQGCQNRNILLL